MAVDITTVNVEALLSHCIENYETLIVDFYAPWCGPCKMIAAPLEQMAQSGVASVVKINGDHEDPTIKSTVDRIMSQYDISAFPTILIFKHKMLIRKVVGANLAQIKAAIA